MNSSGTINIEERVARARQLHSQGLNCCQSVVLAYADLLEGMPPETATRMASAFGRGISGLNEVCGCVSGMAMVAGLRNMPRDSRKMAEQFREENGAITCRTLLGIDGSGIKHKPCNDYVASAAQILGNWLNDNSIEKP
ncbi:MAG: C-GCAxxG-C-C family protein [Bacteroidales bacterium]|nr:C-GCAxxG-C-C family protein [Bacteroidales bacterium]